MPALVSQASTENDQWASLPDNVHFVLFEWVNAAENEARYCWLGWQLTLFGWGVVRLWGRKGKPGMVG